jgi:endonuclease YncB( thermonuclease family)
MSGIRPWWGQQSRARKGFLVSGTAVLALGAGAAANGSPESGTTAEPAPVVTVAPTTTAEHVRSVPATVAPTTAAPTTEPAPVVAVTYTVVHVVDGDTLDVAPSDGSPTMTVRLIGIDAPERGECEADTATWTLASMVDGQPVSLTPGGDGEDTDRYGRLLRYVDVAGVDAGLRLVTDGLAAARYASRDGYGAHDRESAYVAADEASPDYACPPPTTTAPPTTQAPPPPPPPPPPAPVFAAPAPPASNGCDPNYTGCVPIDADVDCAGGSGNGPSYTGYVQVIGRDIYDLDRDGDGEACE